MSPSAITSTPASNGSNPTVIVKELPVGAIVGSIIGAGVLISAAILLSVWICTRGRPSRRQSYGSDSQWISVPSRKSSTVSRVRSDFSLDLEGFSTKFVRAASIPPSTLGVQQDPDDSFLSLTRSTSRTGDSVRFTPIHYGRRQFSTSSAAPTVPPGPVRQHTIHPYTASRSSPPRREKDVRVFANDSTPHIPLSPLPPIPSLPSSPNLDSNLQTPPGVSGFPPAYSSYPRSATLSEVATVSEYM